LVKRRKIVLSAAALLVAFSCVVWMLHRQSSSDAPAKLHVKAVSEATGMYAAAASSEPPQVPGVSVDREPTARHVRVTRTERRDRARDNLLSDDPPARRRAASVLGRVGTEDDIDTLARLVATENDRRTRVIMIRALSRNETPESIRALDECLTAGDRRVQIAAIRSLARMKSPEARASLYKALESGSALGAEERRLIERRLEGSSSPQL
jgi:hypothetical protein